MKRYIEKIIKVAGIGIIVFIGWQSMEIALLGKINPNKVDNVIFVILVYSLYKNLENWRK